jgi:hypothetical protein
MSSKSIEEQLYGYNADYGKMPAEPDTAKAATVKCGAALTSTGRRSEPALGRAPCNPFAARKAGMSAVPFLGVRSKSGPELRPAGTTQRLNLERKLYGPASQRQVLGFQTFE